MKTTAQIVEKSSSFFPDSNRIQYSVSYSIADFYMYSVKCDTAAEFDSYILGDIFNVEFSKGPAAP